ncbi:MAG: hypothetical protein ABI947_07445 [Chloroflexota bacterium]
MATRIVPRIKLLIRYDIRDANEAYYQFVLSELQPAMQGMGLHMLQVYHTAYGHYPMRQLEFVAEDIETVAGAMHSTEWQDIENKFKQFTFNYSTKVVRFRNGFQF